MGNRIGAKLSLTISACRFPLAFFVVYIHSIGDPNAALFLERHFFSIDFLSFVVPTFFIFSGYLFVWNISEYNNWYREKLKKRVKTLLIPYVLWNLIALLLDYIKYSKGGLSWINYSDTTCWQVIYNAFIDYKPINLPLWYIRDLIILIVISPILYKFIKGHPTAIILIIVLYFADLKPFIVDPIAITFFSIGMFLGIHHRNLIVHRNFSIILFCLTILSLIIHKMLDVSFAFNCYRIMMPFIFIFAISVLIHRNYKLQTTLKFMSKYSEIIYYSHYPLTLIVSIKILTIMLPDYSIINYITIPVFAVLMSIGLYYILSNVLLLYKFILRI